MFKKVILKTVHCYDSGLNGWGHNSKVQNSTFQNSGLQNSGFQNSTLQIYKCQAFQHQKYAMLESYLATLIPNLTRALAFYDNHKYARSLYE